MSKTRKVMTVKIEELSEKERQVINRWANGQKNIQQSICNLIMHIEKQIGDGDVMDFDIQNKLHTFFSAINTESVQEVKNDVVSAAVPVVTTVEQQLNKTKENDNGISDAHKAARATFED